MALLVVTVWQRGREKKELPNCSFLHMVKDADTVELVVDYVRQTMSVAELRKLLDMTKEARDALAEMD